VKASSNNFFQTLSKSPFATFPIALADVVIKDDHRLSTQSKELNAVDPMIVQGVCFPAFFVLDLAAPLLYL
jgi:hypothetical protein